MAEQYDFFGGCEEPPVLKHKVDNVKRNWENRFQRWSNKMELKSTDHYGKCGCGLPCDYCSDMSKGRPCVRALNEYLRIADIKIDYDKLSFEDVWDGRF